MYVCIYIYIYIYISWPSSSVGWRFRATLIIHMIIRIIIIIMIILIIIVILIISKSRNHDSTCSNRSSYDSSNNSSKHIQSYMIKGIWRQGIGSFVGKSYVSTLCPVVICPYLCTSDGACTLKDQIRLTIRERLN